MSLPQHHEGVIHVQMVRTLVLRQTRITSSGTLHVTDLNRIPNQHGLLTSRMQALGTTTLILIEEHSVLTVEGSQQAPNS